MRNRPKCRSNTQKYRNFRRSLRSRSQPRLEVQLYTAFYQSAGIYLAAVFPFFVCTYSLSASRPSAEAINSVGASTPPRLPVALPSVYLMPNQTLSRLPGLAPEPSPPFRRLPRGASRRARRRGYFALERPGNKTFTDGGTRARRRATRTPHSTHEPDPGSADECVCAVSVTCTRVRLRVRVRVQLYVYVYVYVCTCTCDCKDPAVCGVRPRGARERKNMQCRML